LVTEGSGATTTRFISHRRERGFCVSFGAGVFKHPRIFPPPRRGWPKGAGPAKALGGGTGVGT